MLIFQNIRQLVTNLMLVSDKSHSITDIATFNKFIKIESIHIAKPIR